MAGSEPTSQARGGWEEGDFAGTVAASRGEGVNVGISNESRFISGVARLVVRRAARIPASEQFEANDVAIFVLLPSPPPSVPAANRVPMLDNGLTPILGRIWFSSVSVVSAHYGQLPQGDDNSRFNFVCDDLDVGSCPTIIYDPRLHPPELRWYPKGLEWPDMRELKSLAVKVNKADVESAIDFIYQQCLITPSATLPAGNPWKKASKAWPRSDAEAVLHSVIRSGLVTAFPACTIRPEQPIPAGKYDLGIEKENDLDRSIVNRIAVLELKVLRSFSCSGNRKAPGESAKRIDEGTTQAAEYRTNLGAEWSTLCCFDMRENDLGCEWCHSEAKNRASHLDVALWRWFLFHSSRQYRNAGTR